MGADIHLYVERKLKNGDWAFVRDLNETINGEGLRPWGGGAQRAAGGFWTLSGRNYNLFSLLAGVRGDGPEAKGLPGDVSDYLEEEADVYGSDGHSHSWSTPLELMEAYIASQQAYDEGAPLDKYIQMRVTEGAEMALEAFMRDMCSLDMDQGDEYRFVYWFDN
jgi:hypothetical protein